MFFWYFCRFVISLLPWTHDISHFSVIQLKWKWQKSDSPDAEKRTDAPSWNNIGNRRTYPVAVICIPQIICRMTGETAERKRSRQAIFMSVIIRHGTGQQKHVIIIRTAFSISLICRFMFMMVTGRRATWLAISGTACMVWMDILTGDTCQNCRHKTISTGSACMHIKANDTETVPYQKH